MVRTAEEEAAVAGFSQIYVRGQCDMLRGIERAVCGCDYGGTSWTTQSEADKVVDLLDLRPGRRLLEVGAGAGWPGLYVAQCSGCDLVLTDLALDGLRIARERAVAEGLMGECWFACADGAALPLQASSFDAIHHSDVLCCLIDKEGLLRACRRVVRRGGVMAFSTILIAPVLTAAEHERAVVAGPPFVAADAPYDALLHKSGWEPTHWRDVTREFLETVRKHVHHLDEHAGQLAKAIGQEDAEIMVARSRQRAEAIEQGLLCRAFFRAVPAPATPT